MNNPKFTELAQEVAYDTFINLSYGHMTLVSMAKSEAETEVTRVDLTVFGSDNPKA